MKLWLLSLLLFALAAPALADDAPGAAALYAKSCAECHGADRLGGKGPALLPENMGRLTNDQAAKVIAEGRAATQMPAFSAALSETEIASLAEYIFAPPTVALDWGEAEIRASRVVVTPAEKLRDRPMFDADPLNLFVVVESGDHHVSILDGDTFERLARFESRYALHGGPKFSPDGRFVHFVSRDGWVTRYDLWGLTVVAEVRAGINARNIALSHDGKVLAVANYLPHTLVMLNAETLEPLAVIPAKDVWGKKDSRVSAVYQAPTRQSFVVALKDLPEVWEVAYSDPPPPAFAGLVHSYETGAEEALATTDRFPIRRTEVETPLDDFFFDQSYTNLIGASRDGDAAVVVNLDVRRPIKKLPLGGMPHLGSGITFDWNGTRVLATPHVKDAAISVIDLKDWHLVKRIETAGPGMFMRSHENSPYAWVDTFMGKPSDRVHIIDKRTLEIVKTLQPAPGKTVAHVEFTRDGRYALLSLWDMDGALIVYDAATFEEVRRIPASKPSGKYNVWNKITFSEGTSH